MKMNFARWLAAVCSLRAGPRLPVQADPFHHPLRPRRGHRHHGAPGRPEAGAGPGPTGPDRERRRGQGGGHEDAERSAAHSRTARRERDDDCLQQARDLRAGAG